MAEMAQFDHVAIEIRTDDALALNIKNKLDKLPNQNQYTIFRPPSYIRECNKNFYEPRIVSIGPYHRDREHLKCMEEHKLQYIRQFLSQNTNITLNKYLEVLRGLEPAARGCYHEKIDMDSDQFVEMLLLDACFIIQLAQNFIFEEGDTLHEIGYTPLIKNDILMLENQIPFFVLKSVFDLYVSIDDDTYSSQTPSNIDSISQESEIPKVTLSYLLVHFLQPRNESTLPAFLQHGYGTLPLPDADINSNHLLDFYYHIYMSSQVLPKKLTRRRNLLSLRMCFPRKTHLLVHSACRRPLRMIVKGKHQRVPCATELEFAGITFKKAESKSIFNVSFSNGVLRIPYTSVEEATRPQLMNLIAFERCSGSIIKPLTSYAVFMNCIISTPRDVVILQQRKIIENKLADEKAVVEFFNQLKDCCDLDYEENHLSMLFKKVKNYCDSPLQKHRAKLQRDYFTFHRSYFGNPWSVVSVIAAIVLLLLTFLQTMYSVMAYYRPSH